MGLRYFPQLEAAMRKVNVKQLQKRGSLHQRFQRLIIHYHILLETGVVLMATGHSYLMRLRLRFMPPSSFSPGRLQRFLGLTSEGFPTAEVTR
jgi:hypothetical protein